MTPLLLKYPEDWSGTLPSNRITGESHTVPRIKNKCYALDGGPFFTGSLVITVANTGKVLIRNVDYKPIFLYQDASIYAGQEVCAAIAIINEAIDGELLTDYQIVGGPYVSLVDALYQAIEALQLDDRPINWDDIKNKPELYPPEPHIHHVSAIYGTEHVCMAIYALKQAMLIGNAAEMERVWDALGDLRKEVLEWDKEIKDLMYDHINRLDNPHEVNKSQVGLGNVPNLGLADKLTAETGTSNGFFMTPLSVQWAIAKQAGDVIDAHAKRTDNPHQVTKAQVGLGSVLNYGIADDNESKAASVNNKYITPYGVGLAINELAVKPLQAHINNSNNPHNTTKAQVGLGSVDNFATATAAQAAVGTATNLFMTPSTTVSAINTFATPLINAHANRRDNPHGVTVDQISAVPNWRKVNGQTLTQDIWVGGVLPGTIIMWAADWVPSGWLMCDGGWVGNNPNLANIVGQNVPDLRGVFIRGTDRGRGLDPNRGVRTYQDHMLVDHNHIAGVETSYMDVEGSNTRNVPGGGEFRWYSNRTGGVNPGGNQGVPTGHEVRPRNVALNFIIAGDYATTSF